MNPPKYPSLPSAEERVPERSEDADRPFDNGDGASADGERLTVLQADNQRLRDMLAAAGRLAEFGRFAAKQNHELRQPLFAIKGLAQLLLDRDKIDVDEVRDFARHIVEQAERLTRLVGDLRHVSMPAPQTGKRSLDVSPVLLRVASLLDWRFRKGVTLRTELAADLPPVAVAPHELEQVLINLLSNALDAVAGRPNPIIQVRVSVGLPPDERDQDPNEPARRRPFVEIFVADNGHGVPRTARERLFDNFFTTKGEEAGTGLGLAVSREIARGAAGDLELLDAPGTWAEPAVTVFRLTLPAAAERTSS
jgi:two-component system C4-dicarboxylate transport sensor histidine kinase DctB